MCGAWCCQFVHAVADGLCGRASPRYVDYGHVWSPSEWLSVITKNACSFFMNSQPSDCEQLSLQLRCLAGCHQSDVEACVGVRRDELRSAVTLSSLALGSAQLRDFDWKLKLALSSDRHSALQTPLLALELDVQRHDPPHDPRSAVCDTSRDAVTVELSAAELGTLITALENASKVVQQLK
uniref:COMM domain containing 8 n=1 Tax=Petromyzon marinus TaxID=7757 RepID=S4RTQ7_PETMA